MKNVSKCSCILEFAISKKWRLPRKEKKRLKKQIEESLSFIDEYFEAE